jgi:crotonobetainyl-CoA:carnitine CoA-transferase CaiB-like acyl-CoA transferase
MGADVIKVEPPWGDNIRTRSEDGNPPQVQYLNPNKKGLSLNLKSERGKQALFDLVEKADVLIENYATGKMDELGVGYETLREVNPQLIYAHGSGYGDTGPYSKYPAMDLTVQAMSGIIETTGFPDGDPVKAGPAICDFLGGTHLAVGVLSALYHREFTGEGQYVEIGMMDCVYPTLASAVSSWVSEKDAPPRTGNRHSGLSISPYNVYESEDGHIAIICTAERHWHNLAELMGREDLIGKDGYDSKASRAERIDKIDKIVQSWIGNRSKDETVELLLENNVPCAPVRNVEEIVDDDHLKERGMINPTENYGEGKERIPIPGLPIQFSAFDAEETEQAPLLDEHKDEILSDILGYSNDDIRKLREAE